MWEGISAEASTCVVVSVAVVVEEVVVVVAVVADRLTVLQSTPRCSWHSPDNKQGMKRDKFCKLIVLVLVFGGLECVGHSLCFYVPQAQFMVV